MPTQCGVTNDHVTVRIFHFQEGNIPGMHSEQKLTKCVESAPHSSSICPASTASTAPSSRESPSSCGASISLSSDRSIPAKKRKVIGVSNDADQDTHATHARVTDKTADPTQLLVALVPLKLHAPSQRLCDDDAGAGSGRDSDGKVVKKASEALELLLSKGHKLLEEAKRKGEVRCWESSVHKNLHAHLCTCATESVIKTRVHACFFRQHGLTVRRK